MSDIIKKSGKVRKTILVAEDEPISLGFIVTVLEQNGYNVVTADDGQSALNIATNAYFDLLLVDINMPLLSGVQIMEKLRINTEARSKNSPAIAITADHDSSLIRTCRDAGFQDMAYKPIDSKTLTRQVGMTLGELNLDEEMAVVHLPTFDDKQGLARTNNNPKILASMRQLLAEQVEDMRKKALDASINKDWKGLHDVAHKLLSAAGFTGAVALRDACEKLIEKIKAGQDCTTEHAMLDDACANVLQTMARQNQAH